MIIKVPRTEQLCAARPSGLLHLYAVEVIDMVNNV